MSRGQALEAAGTGESLAGAVRCYDEAIAILRAAQTGDPTQRHSLAVAWMNRGNALLKKNTAASLADAVLAYDEAIAVLAIPVLEKNSAARNSLGAAWTNRGLTLHRRAAAGDLDETVRSHREAIAALQTLPSGENPWYRRNLAAAWTNLANALLDTTVPDRFTNATEAAQKALALVAGEETLDPIAADLALKARRCLCDALGHLLSANETAGLVNDATIMEAGDTVDAALALIRQWEQRGVSDFRLLARRFFFFGVHFYRLHQPHFLAEFVLENLDPRHSPGAITEVNELYATADEAIAFALEMLRRSPVCIVGNPADDRLLTTARELRAAQARLSELRASP